MTDILTTTGRGRWRRYYRRTPDGGARWRYYLLVGPFRIRMPWIAWTMFS